MEVILRRCDGIELVEEAARTTMGTENLLSAEVGEVDYEYIEKIIKHKNHTSIGEQLVITYRINQFPRNVLQEISRHRIGVSPAIRTTRHRVGFFAFEGNLGLNCMNSYSKTCMNVYIKK